MKWDQDCINISWIVPRIRNEKILIKGLLYWDWEEVSIYEYEKDKDITMLVCSLGFEYKYLNISKVIEVPTRILWMRWEERGNRIGPGWRGWGLEEEKEEEKSIV